MSKRLHVETFQLRVNNGPVVTSRGLAVTVAGRKQFLDPQTARDQRFNTGPSPSKHLWLELSRRWWGQHNGWVEQLALNAGFLEGRYRLYQAQLANAPGYCGQVALVAVVDHNLKSRRPFMLEPGDFHAADEKSGRSDRLPILFIPSTATSPSALSGSYRKVAPTS